MLLPSRREQIVHGPSISQMPAASRFKLASSDGWHMGSATGTRINSILGLQRNSSRNARRSTSGNGGDDEAHRGLGSHGRAAEHEGGAVRLGGHDRDGAVMRARDFGRDIQAEPQPGLRGLLG